MFTKIGDLSYVRVQAMDKHDFRAWLNLRYEQENSLAIKHKKRAQEYAVALLRCGSDLHDPKLEHEFLEQQSSQ